MSALLFYHFKDILSNLPLLGESSSVGPTIPIQKINPEHRSPLLTRLTAPHTTTTYHLASRVNGDLPLWGDDEKSLMRAQLEKTSGFCGIQVLNFVLLQNHFHLLVRVPALATRDELTRDELFRRIRILYGDWIVEMLSEAMTHPALAEAGTANLHFGSRCIQAGVGLASLEESAKDWALRELERYRGAMHDLSKFVSLFKQRFSIWYNNTHGRFGTLWADRFRSMIVEDAPFTLAAISAYMDMNPVRAGLVENPTDYPFSGLGEATRQPGLARDGLADLLRSEEERKAGGNGGASGPAHEERGDAVRIGSSQQTGPTWQELAERYRKLLWGDRKVGEKRPSTALEREDPAKHDTSVNPDNSVPSVLADLPPTHERDLVLADFFRWRQDVFLKGVAMGSKSFIERVFRENRQAFGASEEMADRLVYIRGVAGGWRFEGMRVLRSFRLPASIES